jgi:hypothetical protein
VVDRIRRSRGYLAFQSRSCSEAAFWVRCAPPHRSSVSRPEIQESRSTCINRMTLLSLGSSSATLEPTSLKSLPGLPSPRFVPLRRNHHERPHIDRTPSPTGSAPRFSRPLSGFRDPWLRGLVSCRLRPWETRVFEDLRSAKIRTPLGAVTPLPFRLLPTVVEVLADSNADFPAHARARGPRRNHLTPG